MTSGFHLAVSLDLRLTWVSIQLYLIALYPYSTAEGSSIALAMNALTESCSKRLQCRKTMHIPCRNFRDQWTAIVEARRLQPPNSHFPQTRLRDG